MGIASERHPSRPDLSAVYVFGAAGACAVLVTGIVLASKPASALPSFARQTGQPCATCHNGAFPQLTPFGRQFKLNGYTAGGHAAATVWRMMLVRPERRSQYLE